MDFSIDEFGHFHSGDFTLTCIDTQSGTATLPYYIFLPFPMGLTPVKANCFLYKYPPFCKGFVVRKANGDSEVKMPPKLFPKLQKC